ncbi:MAG: hypothetical protein V4568_07835 [Pseudomonadota bacterium]
MTKPCAGEIDIEVIFIQYPHYKYHSLTSWFCQRLIRPWLNETSHRLRETECRIIIHLKAPLHNYRCVTDTVETRAIEIGICDPRLTA